MHQISNHDLKKYYYGALYFEETNDGYLQAFQYNKQQMEYFKKASEFWYVRCMASTAKTLEFETSATELSFEYKLIWIGSKDSVEVAVNGMIAEICYLEDIPLEGRVAFKLPPGDKKVIVYLPADATMLIRKFEINERVSPVSKNERVLWMGDSITQGYGPLRSANTYVSVANRILNYDIINQGVGGYKYDKEVLLPMEGYYPDKIVVAYGTNQYRDGISAVAEYYDKLMELYPDVPILCITPLWRGDRPEDSLIFKEFCDTLKVVCQQYSNVKIVDGFQMVPHLPEYFIDNLHPNSLGAELYGRNLVETIRRIAF